MNTKKRIFLIALLLITAVAVVSIILVNNNIKNDFTVCFEEPRGEKQYITTVDGRAVYSTYGKVYVQIGLDVVSLEEALNNKRITMDMIVKKMKVKDSLNDGGTVVYFSNGNKHFNSDVYLFDMKKIDGDGYITDYCFTDELYMEYK